MKTVKFNRCVLVPKVGTFNKGQPYTCDDKYAKHLVDNMQVAQVIEDISTDPADKESSTITEEQILVAMAGLDQSDRSLYTTEGIPKVEVLERVIGADITAEQRDEAFKVFKSTE